MTREEIRDLAREFLDEHKHAEELAAPSRALVRRIFGAANKLGDQLLKLARGRALLVDDLVLIPIRTRTGVQMIPFRVMHLTPPSIEPADLDGGFVADYEPDPRD